MGPSPGPLPASPMTDPTQDRAALVREAEERHKQHRVWPQVAVCGQCGGHWPCLTQRLATALTDAEADRRDAARWRAVAGSSRVTNYPNNTAHIETPVVDMSAGCSTPDEYADALRAMQATAPPAPDRQPEEQGR